MKIIEALLRSEAPAAVVLIRLAVGAVFLAEGIQKFLFPADPDRLGRLAHATCRAGPWRWVMGSAPNTCVAVP